ncbi:Mechanosensitive ion channel-domain-containing protein [Fomes fomentarius]|nr:Mechanosensitive ion channel-domain-containing protein [Fomes fomentarius]
MLNVSIVTRWIIFIIPMAGILWIPAILQFTKNHNARALGVPLLYWSIWLTVVWVGWWAALAMSMLLPPFLRSTIGVVIVSARKYIDWLEALNRYGAFFAWTVAIFIAFYHLILMQEGASPSDLAATKLIANILLPLMISACILFLEKILIQWIAGKFHERSYAERIMDQKFAMKVLVTLYTHSTDIPGRSDTLRDGPAGGKRKTLINPQKLFKKALKGVRTAATTTTTVLGNVASEIAGTSVLQPNSPPAMVKTALESANKSRLLARRLFYSFVRPGADRLQVEDVARFFPSYDEADHAFTIFDKDMNGDVNRDEVEMACMEIHREQLSIEHSMRDLDSAVGRLDNIFMSVYFIIVVLTVFAFSFEAQVVTLLSSAGTLVLGLSWLIGSSLAEVLTSIIFLFIKHPYDVGDRVRVGTNMFTVKEMRLLSTIFLDSNACLVQVPNTVLNGMFIHNIRRSPQMSEPFEFDVAYDTSFKQIERLRDLMLTFLKAERRDYQPIFDVCVMDIPGQEKMTLHADIKYKSNWQQGTLKAQRRNKWICALKASMEKAKIYGPGGNPNVQAGPTKYTLIPYEDVLREERQAERRPTAGSTMSELQVPESEWTFADRNSAIVDDSQDVFNEGDQLYMVGSRQNTAGMAGRHPSMSTSSAYSSQTAVMPISMPGPRVRSPAQMSMDETELRTDRTPHRN